MTRRATLPSARSSSVTVWPALRLEVVEDRRRRRSNWSLVRRRSRGSLAGLEPGRRPPASPASTSPNRRPRYGVGAARRSAMKITNATKRFIATPASKDRRASDQQRCADERARIVRVVAVLALELDEAADRQPVERVERLAVDARGPWPAAGSRCRTRGRGRSPGGRSTKWPSSWTSTRLPRITKKRTMVIEVWRSRVMRAIPTGPRRERGPDLGIERDELVEVGRLVGAVPEPVDRVLEQRAGCPGSRACRRGTGRRRPRRRRSAQPSRASRSGPPRGRCAGPGSAPRRALGSRAGRPR